MPRTAILPRPASPAADLDAQLERLAHLDRIDLERQWRELAGARPPPDLPRSLLQRLCADRLQTRHFGGFDAVTRAALAAAARGKLAPERTIKPGSVLVREHAGVLHEVTVLSHGYAWNGATYASLSAVARAMTGKTWNGPRFFGLRERSVTEPAAER